MKVYRVLEVRKSQAEATMNAMARDGWEVLSVTFWSYWRISLLITFVKEQKM